MMKTIKLYTIAAFVIIFSSIAFAEDVQLPEGWQTPIEKEIPDKHSHGKNEKYLSVDADFNGDGQIDSAKLLIKSPGPGMGLIVFIKNQGKYIVISSLNRMKQNGLR